MIFSSLSPEDFSKQMYNQDVIVIDVRTPEEHLEFWVLAKVDLYLNMHDYDFFERLWDLDRKTPYLIYCWHANRTNYLLQYMHRAGFETVSDLAGGTELWETQWFELVKKT